MDGHFIGYGINCLNTTDVQRVTVLQFRELQLTADLTYLELNSTE